MSFPGFPNERLEELGEAWDLFYRGELGRPMLHFGWIQGEGGGRRSGRRKMQLVAYPPEVGADEIIDIEDEHLRGMGYVGDSFPYFSLDFGPGSLSAYLGARVEVRGSVWFMHTAERLADIPESIDRGCFVYRRAREVLDAAVSRWAGGPVLIQPSNLSFNLDVLSQLRTPERLLTDLVDDPDTVKAKLRAITEAWMEAFGEEHGKVSSVKRHFVSSNGTLARGSTCYIQSDFGYMVSPEMFSEFAMPDIAAIADFLDHPCYHLDGIPQLRHLPQILAIDKVRVIEFVQGAGSKPPMHWTDVYRAIHRAGKQCMIFIGPKDALDLKEAMGGTLRGFSLFIVGAGSRDEAEGLYRTLIK